MSSSAPAPLAGQVALGGASFSIHPQRDDALAIATIRAGYEAGIRTFDSARAYAPADDPLHNERLFRIALAGHDDVLIATKGGHFREPTGQWAIDNRPERLRRDIEDSLRALGVEQIGLYYLHRADGSESIEDAVGALEQARAAGLIAAIGVSNVTRSQLEEARAITSIAAVQNPHSATHRESAELIMRCEELSMAFFAYSPLGGMAEAGTLGSRLPHLAHLAAARGMSVQRLAIASLLASSPAVSVVVGAGRPETASDAAAAASESWDEAARAALALDYREGR